MSLCRQTVHCPVSSSLMSARHSWVSLNRLDQDPLPTPPPYLSATQHFYSVRSDLFTCFLGVPLDSQATCCFLSWCLLLVERDQLLIFFSFSVHLSVDRSLPRFLPFPFFRIPVREPSSRAWPHPQHIFVFFSPRPARSLLPQSSPR